MNPVNVSASIWAGGPVCAIGASVQSTAHKCTLDKSVWDQWIYSSNVETLDSTCSTAFPWESGLSWGVYNMMSYDILV